MEKKEGTVRDFEAKSAVGIFGAPISWVALLGALIGAMSIVPFLFYPLGGGFLSAGIGIFGPVGGILLGPWAGFVAGFIGGLIGMVISPAAYPLGLVDVTLSGALVPLAWGLMQPRYRKIVFWAFPLVMIAATIIPYHWPGEAIDLGGVQEPANILQWSHGWLGMLMFLFLAPQIWKMYRSESQAISLTGFALNMFMATVLWMTPWVFPWYGMIRLPFDAAVPNSWANWWVTAIPMTLTSTIIGYFLIRAVRRGNLRRIPGSYLTFGEK